MLGLFIASVTLCSSLGVFAFVKYNGAQLALRQKTATIHALQEDVQIQQDSILTLSDALSVQSERLNVSQGSLSDSEKIIKLMEQQIVDLNEELSDLKVLIDQKDQFLQFEELNSRNLHVILEGQRQVIKDQSDQLEIKEEQIGLLREQAEVSVATITELRSQSQIAIATIRDLRDQIGNLQIQVDSLTALPQRSSAFEPGTTTVVGRPRLLKAISEVSSRNSTPSRSLVAQSQSSPSRPASLTMSLTETKHTELVFPFLVLGLWMTFNNSSK